MSSNTLEIIQGLAQAAANAYDGVQDENFTPDGDAKKTGLKREEGHLINDKRVIDGFSVKFYGNMLCIKYQGEVKLKEVYAGNFENDMNRMLNEIKKFLQKEYKVITGKAVALTKDGDSNILVQSTSRVRTWVQAYQHYKIGGIDKIESADQDGDINRDVTRKFLDQFSDKRPQNDKLKKGDNQK